MKKQFEEEIKTIQKPEFMLENHKRELLTRVQGKLFEKNEKRGNTMMKRILNPNILIPLFVVTLVAMASLSSLRLNTAAYFVTLQINPSMEIELDRDARVIEVTALNEEARILLSNLDLDNKKIDVAFEEIIKEANRLGYVNLENQFEVSIRDARNNTATLNVTEILANIQSKMEETLKNEGLTNNINVVAVTNDQYATAKSLGIAPSEYMKLIEYNVSIEAIKNVVDYATAQMLDDAFEDEFDDVVEAWVDMLKTGVSQEQALAVIRLSLTSEKTLDEVEDIAKAYRSFIQSGLSEADAYTKLQGIIAMDPSLDALDDYDDDDSDDDNDDDDDSDDDDYDDDADEDDDYDSDDNSDDDSDDDSDDSDDDSDDDDND